MARSLRTAIATAAMVATISLLASSEAAQQEEEKERIFHKRHIPNRPDRPSIREQVTKKHVNRRDHLQRHLSQLQSTMSKHNNNYDKSSASPDDRKLSLSDTEYNRHLNLIQGLQRKLAALEMKDPEMVQLEIEEEILLQERMLEGEFLWDMERGELVLRDDLK